MNMISTIGRLPASAAPVASPMMLSSLIGVLMTRRSPNFSRSPAVTPNGPPTATSSPSTMTRRSRSISCAIAWRRPSIYRISAMYFSLHVFSLRVHEIRNRRRRRPRAVSHEAHRLVHARPRGRRHAVDVRRCDRAALDQQAGKAADRVLVPPLGHLVGLAIGLRVADIVPAQPVGEALDDGGAAALARTRN